MGNSTKPRKPHRPKPVVKPLGMRDHHKHELPALAALDALGKAHFAEQHVYDLLSAADLVKRIAPKDAEIRVAAQAVIHAIAEIQHRAQRTCKTGATGPEMTAIRQSMGSVIAYLRDCTNVQIYRASLAAVAEFNKTGALRV